MKTIRVLGVPAAATKTDVLTFFSGLNPIEETLTLAAFGAGTQVATVVFQTEKATINAVRRHGRKLIPEGDPGKAANVTIDTHFYGATPLTNGSDEPGKELDIFLIGSLDRNGFQLWSHLNPTTGHHTFLPRDLLPHDFSHARIVLLGLRGVPTVSDRCRYMQNYLSELVAAVDDPRFGLKCRPAIYLAHSILGVVLKAALVSSMPEARRMQEWCCGCGLFAVPHTREESRWTGKTNVEGKKGKSKWRAGLHGQRSVMSIVNSEFVKAVKENEWHVVSVIEGVDVTVGLNAVMGLGERETVVMTEKNAVGVCRFENRDEAVYGEFVAGIRKIEKGSSLKAHAAWEPIQKWAKSQSPHHRVSLSDSIYGVEEDVFLSSYGIILREGVNFITENSSFFSVFKGEPGTGVTEFALKVANKLQQEDNGTLYLLASKPQTTSSNLWKAAMGEIVDWENQWAKDILAKAYYNRSKGASMSPFLPVSLVAAGGVLKYLFIYGIDQNPHKESILRELLGLIAIANGKLKVILSVRDDNDLGLSESQIQRFPLFTEDVCQAHFQKFASLQLEKLQEGYAFGRITTLDDRYVTSQSFSNTDELYKYIFNSLLYRQHYDGVEDFDKSRKALIILAFAYRPLHIEELLLAVRSGGIEDIWNLEVELSEFRMFLEENLGPLLEFDVEDLGMITLANEHVRTFLSSNSDAWNTLLGEDVAERKVFVDKCHLEILAACLKALRRYSYHRNRTADMPRGWKRKEGNPYETGFYDYASQYWVEHLKAARAAAAKDGKIGHLMARLAYERFQDAAKGVAWSAASMTTNISEFQQKKAFAHLGLHAYDYEHGQLVYELAKEQAKFIEASKPANSVLQGELYYRQTRRGIPDPTPFTPDTVPLEPEPLQRTIVHLASSSLSFICNRLINPPIITYTDLFQSLPSRPLNRSSTWTALASLRQNTTKATSYTYLSDLTRRTEFVTLADQLRHLTILHQTTGISTSPDLSIWNGQPLINVLAAAAQTLNSLATFDFPTKIANIEEETGLGSQFFTQYDLSANRDAYTNTATLFDPSIPTVMREKIQLATSFAVVTASNDRVSFVTQFRTLLLFSFFLDFFTWKTMRYHGFLVYAVLLVGMGMVAGFTRIFYPHWGVIVSILARVLLKKEPSPRSEALVIRPELSRWEAPSVRNLPKAMSALCIFRILRLLMFGEDAFQANILKALIFATLWGLFGWGNLSLEPFFAGMRYGILGGKPEDASGLEGWKRNFFPIWASIDTFHLVIAFLPDLLAWQPVAIPEWFSWLFQHPPTFENHLTGSIWWIPALYLLIPLWGTSGFNILRTCIFVTSTLTNTFRLISLSVDYLITSELIGLVWVWFTFYVVYTLFELWKKIYDDEDPWEMWMRRALEVKKETARVEWDEGRRGRGRDWRGEMMFGGLE